MKRTHWRDAAAAVPALALALTLPPCAQAAPPTHHAVRKAVKHPRMDRRIYLRRQRRWPGGHAVFPDRDPGMIPEINAVKKPATQGRP